MKYRTGSQEIKILEKYVTELHHTRSVHW